MNEPITTNGSSPNSSSSPTISVGFRRRYRLMEVLRSVHKPSSRADASETTVCSVIVELTSTSPVRDSGVQQRIDQIEEKRGEPQRHDNPEDDSLDQEVVRLPY